MNRTVLILILLLLAVDSAAANELVKMAKVKSTNSAQLYFTFREPPHFSTNADRRRLDIHFPDTTMAKDLAVLQPDKDIVKILSREFQGQLIVSLFFRYQPQEFAVNPGNPGTIVLDVDLGNEYSKSYRELARRLKGLEIVDRSTIDFTNPLFRSPWSKNWTAFFADYEPQVKNSVPVAFTSPPFPIIALLRPGLEENTRLIDEQMATLADQGLWDHLAAITLEKIDQTPDIEDQKLLALVYGEALARGGDFEAAYKQLYLLNAEYPEEELAVYAQYLLVLLRAIMESPLTAEYEFRKLEKKIPDNAPLAPNFLLSRVETALASKEYRRLNALLQEENVALPPEIVDRMRIRQADYWSAIDEPIRARAAYNLIGNSPLLATQPHSWSNSCASLYSQRHWQEAAQCYQKLGTMVTSPENRAFAAYSRQMARLHFVSPYKLINAFSEIADNFPGTSAAEAAVMKKNDLLLLQNPARARTLLPRYQQLGQQGASREIRAAARFKSILLENMIGRRNKAITMARDFLRDFQSGEIRVSAEALLIELLPAEITDLVNKGDYLKALVLARENREFFDKNWIDSRFLVDIADAYHKIGLFDEAQKLYLYLLEVSPLENRERFYPLLLANALAAGNFSLLDDYASQYAYNYPYGSCAVDVLYLRLQGLIAEGKVKEAFKLLPATLPEQSRYYRLAAHLQFKLDNWLKALEALQNLEFNDRLDATEQFMLAESLYHTGNYQQALIEYQRLAEDHPWRDQILYRTADIARRQGRDRDADSLLKELEKSGKDTLWKQLAERELQIGKLDTGL